jgi:DtxR family transcriptional regulator, Mn-dependent transcriptional regulator
MSMDTWAGPGNNKVNHKTKDKGCHSMQAAHVSESTEMYLKSLAELDPHQPVAISRLAGRLGVTQVSATEMVKRLAEQALLHHIPYKGVVLTDQGRAIAGSVIRRQRLWERFLYDHLRIEWARVYQLACDLEHATAPELTEALAEFLGQPVTCPHGEPIPAADGSIAPLGGIPLAALPVGRSGRIISVSAADADVLEYLQPRGLLPGRRVAVLEAAPMLGPLTLAVEGNQVVIGLQMAELVSVEPAPEEESHP